MTRAKRVSADRTQAAVYPAKAKEFLDEARLAQAASRWDAAMLNAIHAAISASDAATIALSGQRSVDPDQGPGHAAASPIGAEERRGVRVTSIPSR